MSAVLTLQQHAEMALYQKRTSTLEAMLLRSVLQPQHPNPTPCTLHPKLETNPTPHTLNPRLKTPHPQSQTLNHKLTQGHAAALWIRQTITTGVR